MTHPQSNLLFFLISSNYCTYCIIFLCAITLHGIYQYSLCTQLYGTLHSLPSFTLVIDHGPLHKSEKEEKAPIPVTRESNGECHSSRTRRGWMMDDR